MGEIPRRHETNVKDPTRPVWTSLGVDAAIREAEEVHQGHVDTLGGTWQHCVATSCCAVRKVLAPLVPEIRSRNDGQSNSVDS